MLVYGDAQCFEVAEDVCREVAEGLIAADRMPPGIERHAALVRTFVRAGELVQGIADQECEAAGEDARSPRQDAGALLLLVLAQEIDRSWNAGLRGSAALADAAPLLKLLDEPAPILTRKAEGFAIYGVYPETYLAAARRSGLGSATRVIGIRSIGLPLAALVAAALGAAPPLSVRPTGHPYRRRVEAGPELCAEIAGSREADFAIVDEGPGLSGSSFAAVAEWLEDNGAARERIHFFPSHPGEPGPEADASIRERWTVARRFTAGFDETLLSADHPVHRLESWVRGLVGPLDEPLRDISGGAWRAEKFGDKPWPPSDRAMERRKFLARCKGETWLVKFAGLGGEGPRKLANARLLWNGGFVPQPAGLVHGFLVERWLEGEPLPLAGMERDRLVRGIGNYLNARASLLRPRGAGASRSELYAMARHNTAEALGDAAARELDRRLASVVLPGEPFPTIETDNRMHAWEWLVCPDGSLAKTDALDHSASHDLVGCQEVGWDVAGAIVEHDLTPSETARLCRGIEDGSGVPVTDEMAALVPCYLAFQIGLWTFALQRADPTETARVSALVERYRSRLIALLNSTR